MSNNRGLKNRVAISNAIDREIYEKLKSYSDDTGIPISKYSIKQFHCISILLKIRLDFF